MDHYYSLSWKHKTELASAYALREVELAHELILLLEGKHTLPFDFELRRIRETRDGLVVDNDLRTLQETWVDYLPNNLAWPLMSERLKIVVEASLTGNEGVDWIACKIRDGNEERLYFVLRFNKMPDVLDMQKTIFVQGTDHIIRPVFARSKINAYCIFTRPSSHGLWKITPGLYVDEGLKKSIQKQKLTGVNFEKVIVS